MEVTLSTVCYCGVLKWFAQGSWCPNYYPLCRPLYAYGLDACFHTDTVNEAYSTKLVEAWMMILLPFVLSAALCAGQYHDQTFTLLQQMLQKLRTQVSDNCLCPKLLAEY
jgi:hypothetical protein